MATSRGGGGRVRLMGFFGLASAAGGASLAGGSAGGGEGGCWKGGIVWRSFNMCVMD